MSIFRNITAAAHTFTAWAEKEWTSIYKTAPAIENILAATLKYAGPALQIVVTAEAGGPAGTEVAKVVADAQAGLLAASSLVYDFGATPSVAGVLEAVQNNLGGLLTATHVTNPKSVDIVTKVIANLGALTVALAPKVTATA